MTRGGKLGFMGVALCALALSQGSAVAQNSTQAPPLSAAKIGGEGPGDPNGAVRALGSADDNQTQSGQQPVTIPKLGGEGERHTGGVPEGTSGPSR